MKTVQDVWESIAKPKYPTLNEQQLYDLRIKAACDWLTSQDTELSIIYDQYVMLRNLMDIKQVE